MERPALQRLLNDIGHGLIDVVVVYKVDGLTRSLADFAKMVEICDRHSVSIPPSITFFARSNIRIRRSASLIGAS